MDILGTGDFQFPSYLENLEPLFIQIFFLLSFELSNHTNLRLLKVVLQLTEEFCSAKQFCLLLPAFLFASIFIILPSNSLKNSSAMSNLLLMNLVHFSFHAL